MSYIKVTTDFPVTDGCEVTFKAPCDCNNASGGLKVYYPVVTESTEEVDGEAIPTTTSTVSSKVFVIKDAHGNSLATTGNVFTQDALVTVKLDYTNSTAYVQNGDTNGYLETQLAGKAALVHTHTSADLSDTLPVNKGGTGATTASAARTNLGAAASSHTHNYLPLTGGTVSGTTNFNGQTNFGSNLYLNGNPLYTKLNGTNMLLLNANGTSNQVDFGWGAYDNNLKATIYGSPIDIQSKEAIYVCPYIENSRSYFVFGATGTGVHSDFRPQMDAVNNIGTSDYKFATFYGYHYYYHSLNNVSDERTKKDISDDISVYKKIAKKITPKRFKYKENDEDRTHIGFIAQDIKSALEDEGLNIEDSSFVKVVDIEPSETIPDGKQLVVGYQEFTALNTALIQEQAAKIEELEQKLSSLEERLLALENK